jgi:hypothetical protein
MTIEDRTIRRAIQAHRESLNSLLTHTITQTPLIAIVNQAIGQATVGFRRGGSSDSATLASRYGLIDLAIFQRLDAVEGQHDRVRLRLIDYQYTITPLGADDPLFRWEFVRFPSSGSFWCRNHLQGPITVNVGTQRSVNLNDWHLPTGWVPIEEIIRFCIVDLGVPPLDGSVDADGNPGWYARLTESEPAAGSRSGD